MLPRIALAATMFVSAGAASVAEEAGSARTADEISFYLRSETDSGTLGDNVTKDARPMVAGQTDGGTKVEVLEDGKVIATTVARDWGYWEAQLSRLSEGEHELRARLVGRTTQVSKPLRLTIDQTPPPPPTIRVTKGYSEGGTSPYRPLPVEGKAEKGAYRVTIDLGGGRTLYPYVRRDGSWSAKVDLEPGARTLTATAFDRAGNRSKRSAPLKIRIIKLQDEINLARLDGKDGTALWARGFGSNCFEDSELVGAADVDADGLGDVLIGGAFAGASGEGKLFGVMGTKQGWKARVNVPALPAGAGFEIVGKEKNQLPYAGIARAGDVNGDGYEDFAVASNANRGATDYLGLLTVLYGSKTGLPESVDINALTPEQGFRILGDRPYRGPSQPIEAVGDINGDGLDDLAFRAYDTVHVLFGKRGFTQRDMTLASLGREDGLQLELRNASTRVSIAGGDLDADGLSDVVVGVTGSGSTGTINIIFGREKLPGRVGLTDYARDAGVEIKSVVEESEWFSVASGFDLNGDDHNDIAVVSKEGYFDVGRLGLVLYGGERKRLKDLAPARRLGREAGFRLAGNGETSMYLQSAGSADVNDDGLDDLILGATNGGETVGFVVYGRRERPAEALDLSALDGVYGYRLVFSGPTSVADIACTVAGAGDVNGDGVDDIVVSGKSANRIDQPGAAAYVVFGRRD